MSAKRSRPDVAVLPEGGGADAQAPSAVAFDLFILSDVCFLREGLLAAFRSDADFPSVGAGATLDEALVRFACGMSGVILLDAAFPKADAVAQRLTDAAPRCQLIVLAIEERAETVIAWAKLGIAGYVPRHASIRQLLDTVKGVIRGEQACAPAITSGLIRHISGLPRVVAPAVDAGDMPLTVREAEILPLLGAGSSNKDIARRLNIGVTTAKCHVHNILNKLRLQRRSQVAHWIQAQKNTPLREHEGR